MSGLTPLGSGLCSVRKEGVWETTQRLVFGPCQACVLPWVSCTPCPHCLSSHSYLSFSRDITVAPGRSAQCLIPQLRCRSPWPGECPLPAGQGSKGYSVSHRRYLEPSWERSPFSPGLGGFRTGEAVPSPEAWSLRTGRHERLLQGLSAQRPAWDVPSLSPLTSTAETD